MFGIFKKKSAKQADADQPKTVFHTDVGMLCLWNCSTYKHITDYDTWEPEFVEDEDIIRNIKKGTYVPINIRSDGVYGAEVKFGGNATLNERERTYLIASSQPYLIKTDGRIALSGMEHVGSDLTDDIRVFDVEPGEYAVSIHLIDWGKEPGSTGPDGEPSANALPDFVVIVQPRDETISVIRQEVETFNRDGAH